MALQRDKVTANAEKLVARGKIDQAIKEYERLLDDSPNDVNTLNRIGDLWVRIERNDEAVKVFRKIADHYSRDGFFLKAIAIYKKINKLDPTKLDIYAKLAELYAKQGLAMEAKSQYQVLADYFLKHGDLVGAIDIYHKIADLDPHSVNLHIRLGDLYQQNHQSAEALREYDRVGRMLLKRGMAAEAMQVFRKALKIESGSADLAESLVGTLLEEKDHANAVEVLRAALESNRENPKLIALLGRTQIASGDLGAARTTLENGLRSNPSDVVIRELLTDVYLKDNSLDQALELIQPLIAVAGARAEGRLAVDLLNRILKSHPSSVVALERLATAQQRMGDEADATETLARLASVHIARSDYEAAESILRDLLSRHEDRPDLKEKLALVLHRTGRSLGDLVVPDITEHSELVPEAPEPPPPAPEVEAAPPPPGLSDEMEFEFEVASETAEPLSAPLAAPPEPEPVPPVSVVEIDQDRAAAAADLAFATERVTEADVFAKYGLTEKAIEHLRGALERVPDFLPAYEKLLSIFAHEGDSTAANATAEAYTALLRQRGDFRKAEEVEQAVFNRKFIETAPEPQGEAVPLIDVAMPEPGPVEPERVIASPPAEEPEEEFELDLDEFADLPDTTGIATEAALEQDVPPEQEAAAQAGLAEAEIEAAGEAPEEEVLFIDEAVAPEEPEAAGPIDLVPEATPTDHVSAPAEPPSLEQPEPEAGLEADIDEALQIEAFESEIEAFPEIEEPAEPTVTPAGESIAPAQLDEAPPLATPEYRAAAEAEELFGDVRGAAASAKPNIEDLGELDFYIEQELFEEANNKLRALVDQFPDDRDLQIRTERLAAARARSAHPAAEPTVSDSPPVVIPAPAPAAVEEEDLFSAEENFFDLAAELENELADDVNDAAAAAEEEQSLEQIFREFKKGVEQQLDSEDYDTHYNLGIAYKEMGLIDEAIGEFQLASKDPKRAIDGCSMLGLCFLEKGMPQLAIKWYSKGLENPEISEEEHLGLLYDLGNAYLEVGDTDNAHKAFLEVYGINSKYRDVVSRIKQLEEVRRVQ